MTTLVFPGQGSQYVGMAKDFYANFKTARNVFELVEDLTKMSNLGNVEKEAEGQEMYRYFAGTYSSLEDANTRLAEARLVGYTDAFVFAKLDGERITLEQAKELLK